MNSKIEFLWETPLRLFSDEFVRFWGAPCTLRFHKSVSGMGVVGFGISSSGNSGGTSRTPIFIIYSGTPTARLVKRRRCALSHTLSFRLKTVTSLIISLRNPDGPLIQRVPDFIRTRNKPSQTNKPSDLIPAVVVVKCSTISRLVNSNGT